MIDRKKTRETGPVVEVWIYRYVPHARGRGGKRSLLANVVPYRGIEAWVATQWGPGKYRFEHRDAQRWVVRVESLHIRGQGAVEYSPKRKASRRVPPAWDGQYAISAAPLIDREVRPIRAAPRR